MSKRTFQPSNLVRAAATVFARAWRPGRSPRAERPSRQRAASRSTRKRALGNVTPGLLAMDRTTRVAATDRSAAKAAAGQGNFWRSRPALVTLRKRADFLRAARRCQAWRAFCKPVAAPMTMRWLRRRPSVSAVPAEKAGNAVTRNRASGACGAGARGHPGLARPGWDYAGRPPGAWLSAALPICAPICRRPCTGAWRMSPLLRIFWRCRCAAIACRQPLGRPWLPLSAHLLGLRRGAGASRRPSRRLAGDAPHLPAAIPGAATAMTRCRKPGRNRRAEFAPRATAQQGWTDARRFRQRGHWIFQRTRWARSIRCFAARRPSTEFPQAAQASGARDRAAIETYDMIRPGDRWLVCLSGGKGQLHPAGGAARTGKWRGLCRSICWPAISIRASPVFPPPSCRNS